MATKATTTPKKVKATAETVSKLRIRVRAFEHKILDSSVKQIIDTALRFDAQVVGPIPLPTEIKSCRQNKHPLIERHTWPDKIGPSELLVRILYYAALQKLLITQPQ